MDTEKKEIVEKKVYEDGKKNYATKGEALGIGIPALVLGGASALALWNRSRGGFGGGTPENVNINMTNESAAARSGVTPTSFQSYAHSCSAQLALTNEMWGLKVGTLNQMYAHRDTDVNEKFQLWKSQMDGDFGLYKSIRDLYDVQNDKLNMATFGLYKNQRDLYDTLNERYAQKFSELDKKVAIMEAIRPYQDKLIQCEIDRAYTAGINYSDRLDCRNIKGVVTLPNTPTVTGFPSQRCGCYQAQTSSSPAA